MPDLLITGCIVALGLLACIWLVALKCCVHFHLGRAFILRFFAEAPGGTRGELRTGTLLSIFVVASSLVLGLLVYTDVINMLYHRLFTAYSSADLFGEVFANEVGADWPNEDNHGPSVIDGLLRHLKGTHDSVQEPRVAGRRSGRFTIDHLFVVLKHYGLLDSKDVSPQALLNSGSPNYLIAQQIQKPSFSSLFVRGDSTTAFVIALADYKTGESQESSCTKCPEECRYYQIAAISAALSQQPLRDSTKRMLPAGRILLNRQPDRGVDSAPGETCDARLHNALATIDAPLSFRSAMLFSRPEPELSAQELTRIVLGWYGGLDKSFDRHSEETAASDASGTFTFTQEQALARFMSVVLGEVRGTQSVRSQRRWINALIGIERYSVIVLAFAFFLLLFARSVLRLPHEVHRKIIVDRFDELRTEWIKDQKRPRALERRGYANDLAGRLRAGKVKEEDESSPDGRLQRLFRSISRLPYSLLRLPLGTDVIETIPLRILKAATDEMVFWEESEQEGAQKNVRADERFIETVSDGERRKLERSRLVFDAILPTFPAIGFVGTVSSLLLAMSQADRIVSTEEFLAKGIAAARVTDILSLCFSTTLMALLCVLLFSPLSLVQGAQEQRLVDDVEEAVQTVLRPEQP